MLLLYTEILLGRVEGWAKFETLDMNPKERYEHFPAFILRVIMHSVVAKCEFNELLCPRIID
jgi:hypothetical protein